MENFVHNLYNNLLKQLSVLNWYSDWYTGLFLSKATNKNNDIKCNAMYTVGMGCAFKNTHKWAFFHTLLLYVVHTGLFTTKY